MSARPAGTLRNWLARLFRSPTTRLDALQHEMVQLSRLVNQHAEASAALERRHEEDTRQRLEDGRRIAEGSAALAQLRLSVSGLSERLERECQTSRDLADRLRNCESELQDGLRERFSDCEKVRLGLVAVARQVASEADNTQKIATALFRRIEGLRRGEDEHTVGAEPPKAGHGLAG